MNAMNTFFNKKAQQKWTWINPDGINEIDFVITNKKEILYNVLNKMSIGSDHRIVKANVVIYKKGKK